MYDNDTISTKQTTKDSIKKRFLEMYKIKPLKKISVSDLVRVCTISRGTFYFHFTDIYALYSECEQDMIDFMEADLTDVNLSIVRRDYNKHINVFCRHIKRYVEYADLLQCFLGGSEEISFRQAWFDSIRRNYEKTMEFSDNVSLLRRNNLILFFAGGQVKLLSNWVFAGCKEPAEDIASIAAQVLFQGVFLQTSKK